MPILSSEMSLLLTTIAAKLFFLFVGKPGGCDAEAELQRVHITLYWQVFWIDRTRTWVYAVHRLLSLSNVSHVLRH